MWSPFQKLIGRNALSDKAPTAARRDAGAPLAAPVAQHGAGAAPASSTATQADPSLDRQFILFLLALPTARERACNANELALLERLADMVQNIGGQTLVPRLPAALPKLMGLIRRDDVSGREMAEHLARDPALLGEVIRIANSASYRSSRPVQSVEDAVTMLGQRGLQQLVTRVAMGPVFNFQQGRYSRTASGQLWKHAERCAHAGAWLRKSTGDSFEAYLAGMVTQVGLMVVLRVLDQEDPQTLPHDALAFHDALHSLGQQLSAGIARQWEFPEAVVGALDLLAAGSSVPPESTLAAALYSADKLAKRLLNPMQESADAHPMTAVELQCWEDLQRSFPAQ